MILVHNTPVHLKCRAFGAPGRRAGKPRDDLYYNWFRVRSAGRQGSFQCGDDAPFEQQVPALVIVPEVVGDLNTLNRGADNLPALQPIGLSLTAGLLYDRLQRLVSGVGEGGFPPLRVPVTI